MNKGKFFLGMMVLSVGLFLNTTIVGHCAEDVQSPPAAAAPEGMPPMDEKMKEMMKYSMPGEQHKVLAGLTGQWNHTIRFWMSPDAKAEESQGSNENKMILGNRFLAEEVKGTAMGQPFEGLGIVGYDNFKGEYSSVWIDNMGTGMMTSSAQYDAATKTFSEQGSMACPMTGEKNRSFRGNIKIVDNDHYHYEMYFKDETGKEFKSMEISYSRMK